MTPAKKKATEPTDKEIPSQTLDATVLRLVAKDALDVLSHPFMSEQEVEQARVHARQAVDYVVGLMDRYLTAAKDLSTYQDSEIYKRGVDMLGAPFWDETMVKRAQEYAAQSIEVLAKFRKAYDAHLGQQPKAPDEPEEDKKK